MTLKQMSVFIAIAEAGSFSKGSEKCGITQSTASQHIIGLEKELGIRLFDRGREGILLTEAGKLFLGRAVKIISDCDGSRSAIRRFLGMEDVTLRIGASDVAASLIIPALLGTFQKDHPTVHLEVNHANSRTIQSQLISEEIELGFIGGSLDDDRIEFEKIGVDTLICVAAADLLAGRKASLSQAELCKVPLIIREDGSGTQKAIDDALAVTWLNKESFTIIARLGSSEAIRNAVQNKAGYAFISDRMIADELATGQLLTVRIPGVHITRTLYAVRRGGRELSPAAAAFLKLVLDQSK